MSYLVRSRRGQTSCVVVEFGLESRSHRLLYWN